MVGVPMVLRDDENFRRIGELFGKTVDDGVFTWGNIDISAGYCLVLTEIGNKIEEVINLAWKNRVYPVWVSEMGDNWVPEFCVDQSAMEAVGTEYELEDGEFRLPPQSPAGAEAPGREDETNKCMGTEESSKKSMFPMRRRMRMNQCMWQLGSLSLRVGQYSWMSPITPSLLTSWATLQLSTQKKGRGGLEVRMMWALTWAHRILAWLMK
ncbi:hypothetical protein L1987_02246 [Smallanthus sonchifolius]|uniref:Uncharacterized protein n=1 Tax=Smallanthus sonchifolius TaxID=185202 RepID=A0ACB9K799_9ASTR|nr:hypothetical protein L1987_02246 [Smallanthus sonchifolius]